MSCACALPTVRESGTVAAGSAVANACCPAPGTAEPIGSSWTQRQGFRVRCLLSSQSRAILHAGGELQTDDTDAQRFAMWHALQLNSLVRWHLSAVTRVAGQHVSANSSPWFGAKGTEPVPTEEADFSKTPTLSMLAYPSYLSLLLIPALLKVWPAASSEAGCRLTAD